MLELRPSLKLCRPVVGSDVRVRSARSVCDRAAGRVSEIVGNTGVVELRLPLDVLLLVLLVGFRASSVAVFDGGGLLRSSGWLLPLADREPLPGRLPARPVLGARNLESGELDSAGRDPPFWPLELVLLAASCRDRSLCRRR